MYICITELQPCLSAAFMHPAAWLFSGTLLTAAALFCPRLCCLQPSYKAIPVTTKRRLVSYL